MIISVDTVKTFDKIQHLFLIFFKTLRKLGREENLLTPIKGIYKYLPLTSYLMVKD